MELPGSDQRPHAWGAAGGSNLANFDGKGKDEKLSSRQQGRLADMSLLLDIILKANTYG